MWLSNNKNFRMVAVLAMMNLSGDEIKQRLAQE
jgi:hypothetical protein